LQFFGILLSLLGLFFFVGTAVGMIRFPDFYTRMHAAGKGDTLSTMLMLSGFGLVSMEDLSMGSWLLFFKIMGVVLFIFITCPTSSHALMRAAFEDDEMPMTEKDLKKPSAKKK
jgi:multicomponent Na+:H+ antiporter subunit G